MRGESFDDADDPLVVLAADPWRSSLQVLLSSVDVVGEAVVDDLLGRGEIEVSFRILPDFLVQRQSHERWLGDNAGTFRDELACEEAETSFAWNGIDDVVLSWCCDSVKGYDYLPGSEATYQLVREQCPLFGCLLP